jgi:ferric-dicitrate binding protein FerR (iron transport regulator)
MKGSFIPLLLYLKNKRCGKLTGISFIDSTSLKVCNNKRILSHKVFNGTALRGQTSMGWFYGFKLHLIVNDRGELLSFVLTPGNTDDRNRDVVKKYLNNSCDKQEFETVYQILSDSKQFENYNDTWNELWESSLKKANVSEESKLEDEAIQLLARHNQHKTKRKVISLPLKKIIPVAASVALLITLSWWVINHVVSAGKDQVVHQANFGELKQVNLADGSTVNIRAASRLIVAKNFNKRKRNLELTGEAFFDVAKDKKREFTVKTEQMKITVLGTSFVIRSFATEETSLVTVNSGKVKVDVTIDGSKKTYTITPNQQLVYNKSLNKVSISEVNSEKHKAFIHKKLYFDNSPLYRVITDLQNIYNVDIQIGNSAIEKLMISISGEFSNASLNDILESICFVHDLNYKYLSDSVVVLESTNLK